MNDRDWDNWIRGTEGTLFGDMKLQSQAKSEPYVRPQAGAPKATGSGESITLEGFFGFVAACFAVYLPYKAQVAWEWYWWAGLFLCVFSVVRIVLVRIPLLTKLLSLATVVLLMALMIGV